jgi:pantoate--beta-alanine ligase
VIPVATTIEDIKSAAGGAQGVGFRVGCVPTMGALHDGHMRLIERAKAISDFVVVTIFVNPKQFGPNEDYSRYPRTLDADISKCTEAGANWIFAPTAAEMYPPNAAAFVDVSRLGDTLCGRSRPGHFRGVCTVVMKLLNIVRPDVAVFGAKDAQQVRIIQAMVLDLNMSVKIDVVPTVRESDGLAMSSRNRYLTDVERAEAPKIYQALLKIRERAAGGETDIARLESALAADLQAIPGAILDYASIVDDVTLAALARLDRPALAAVAVKLGITRLIDNIVLLS